MVLESYEYQLEPNKYLLAYFFKKSRKISDMQL